MSRVLILGPIPVDLINRTLNTDLEPGTAILTKNAKTHIRRDHPADFALVMANLEQVIEAPTYIGQSPRHSDAFELVKRIVGPNGLDIILAAVRLEPNEAGEYHVHSAYRITEEKVTARISAKHLLFPKKKGAG